MGFLGKGARKPVIAREDWILLVLAAADGLLPVQLQKALFLFGQRLTEPDRTAFYEFRPVAGGDFSEQVNSDVHALSKTGLVTARYSEKESSRRYRLTPAGAARATGLEKQAPPALAQTLRNIVSWVRTRSVDQLLRGSSPGAPGSGKRDSVWSR